MSDKDTSPVKLYLGGPIETPPQHRDGHPILVIVYIWDAATKSYTLKPYVQANPE